MKNKSFFIVIFLCTGLQSSINFASEKPSGWMDWLKSKFTTARERLSSREGKVAKAVGPGVIAIGGIAHDLSLMDRNALLTQGSSLLFLAVSVAIIIKSIADFNAHLFSRSNAIDKIKNSLSQIVSNSLLYPTRSSKIHALLKQDEFLEYINDKDGIVQEACANLNKEILSLPYSADQEKADDIIDKKMAFFRNRIKEHVTLTDQINELEKFLQESHQFDIPMMQACASVYFRLKNKQEVEKQLSSEEKASRQSFRKPLSKEEKEAIATRRAMSEAEWKKYMIQKQEQE